MKFKLNLVGVAILAILFVVGCNHNADKKDNAKKDDAVLKAVNEKKEGKKVVGTDTPSVFPMAQQPKGVTIKEFLAKLDLPEVVATVGNEKITKEELIKEVERSIPAQMRNKSLPPQVTAGLAKNLKTVVDMMISRKLLLKLAAKDGIKPSAKLLTNKFDEYIKKLPPQQLEAFKKQLAASGSSIEKHKAEATKDIGAQEAVAIDKWVETKVMPEVTVDDATAEKFYRKNQARFKKPGTVKVAHILVVPEKPSKEKMSDEDKKKFAEESVKKSDDSFIPFDEVKSYLKSSLQKEEIGKKIKTMLDAEKEKCKVKFFVK